MLQEMRRLGQMTRRGGVVSRETYPNLSPTGGVPLFLPARGACSAACLWSWADRDGLRLDGHPHTR
jgi:hypothetical protein